LVCGSCKCKLEHVQTCLSTRVCLTQHPSDTLRLFHELNYRTMYIPIVTYGHESWPLPSKCNRQLVNCKPIKLYS
jgi:hypothetical protein